MPAVATLLSYEPKIEMDLSANEVNLTSAASAGHRITAEVSAAAMNAAFTWERAVSAKRPTGHYNDVAARGLLTGLGDIIAAGLDGEIVDTDASDLDFSTTTPQDPRVTELKGTDRLVAAYILYKGYGSSEFTTEDVVLNPEDLSGMAQTSAVRIAILNALLAGEANLTEKPVDKMFQDLIAADPLRFFEESGKQVAGIFETNNDVAGSGDWRFTTGDKVELKLVFKFKDTVTVYDADGAAKEVIKADDTFSVRLQLEVV